jgi:hypothetical protein
VGWDRWIRTVEIEPALDALEAGTHHHSVETLVRTGCKLVHVVHRFDGVIDVLVADQPIFEREDLPRAYRRLVQALA